MAKSTKVKAPTTGEQITIKPKPPTKAELQAEIEELKAEKAALYERVRAMEQDVERSRPYLALLAQYNEMKSIVEMLRTQKSTASVQNDVIEQPKVNRGGRPVKIQPETRERIRALRAEGESVRRIAEKTGVSVGMVHAIVNGSR